VDKEKHTGGTVVKNEKPAGEFEEGYSGDIHCSGCDELLEKGEVLPATHEHNHSKDWSSNETEHWHECACGDKKDVAEHEGNTPDCVNPSICEECEKQLADKDKTNHTGETVVKNAKEATSTEDGYTGDIYCMGCDTLLELGSVIPMSHEHSYSDEWKSDDKNHWHECSCKDRKDEEAHRFVLGTCSVCGKTSSSFEIDPDELTDAVGSILDTIISAGSGLDFGDLGFGDINLGDLGFGSGNGNGSNGGSDGSNGTGSGNGSNSGSASKPGTDNSTKPGADNGQNGGNGNSGTNTNTNGSTVNKDDNTVSPDTGNGYALGFVISVMLVSTCALAVIRKKESLTA
ncbi:MAG: hypothetical protein IKC20_05600, partial [Clostridia bacterium]|nr:hypothetical protein [Clostridia bacterium]